MLSNLEKWTCPVCKRSLSLNNKVWSCSAHHSFDEAKEGYVNLLLAQHKKSKEPGDNKDMVNARHSFLNSGAYEPLAQALTTLCANHLNQLSAGQASELLLLDIGCSEGYYSSYIQSSFNSATQLGNAQKSLSVYGLDISKTAIRKAAKLHNASRLDGRQGTEPNNFYDRRYAVASSYNMPVADSAVHIALQVFAPASLEETARVLAPGGIWVLVEPANEHLRELKTFVYDNVQQHQEKAVITQHFTLIAQQPLSFKIGLDDRNARLHLLKMTPYYWKISEENKKRLIDELRQVTTDFRIKIYKKSDEESVFT